MSEEEGGDRWRIVGRSLTIWLVLIDAEIAHGVLRAIASDYNVLNGGLMPMGLLFSFFSPIDGCGEAAWEKVAKSCAT
jgi:hypothetical protein